MAGRALQAFEGHLQHQRRRNRAHGAKPLNRVVTDEFVQLLQLLIGKAEIGLADRRQPILAVFIAPYGEGEVRIKAGPAAVAALGVKQYGVDEIRVALPFVPVAFDPSGQIGAVPAFQHQAFNFRSRGLHPVGVQCLHGCDRHKGGEVKSRSVHAGDEGFQTFATLPKGQLADVLFAILQQVIGADEGRMRVHLLFRHRLAVQPLL